MSRHSKNNLYKDQRGIISILVVTILTVILSLIAIGFSKLADRELRQASDREASTQAYYAAQTGINDAKAYLAAGNRAPINGCTTASPYFSQDISNNTGVAKYSCISVDTTRLWLHTTVTPGKPQLLKVSATGLRNLFISWDNYNDSDPAAVPLPGGNLIPEDTIPPHATGVLRVGLYDVPGGGVLGFSTDNNTLSGLSRVYYLYPNGGGGGVGKKDYGSGCYSISIGLKCGGGPPTNTNGSLVYGDCKFGGSKPNPLGTNAPPHYCNSEIQNLPSPTDTYYLYLTAQYAPLSVDIQGTDGSTNVKFVDSQATIDVTGQGSGVLQRIRATVNLDSQFDLPNYAIQSMESICKNFSIDVTVGGSYGLAHPGSENNDGACSVPASGGTISNPPTDFKDH